MMNTQRLEKVLKKMETEGLEQMIISDPYAIYYLTGRFIDPGERLLALYINQSGKNKIFINNLFTVPEDLGVEKFRFSDTDDYLTPLCDCVEAGKPLGIDKTFAARFLIPVIDHSGASSYKVSSICVDEVRACKDDEEREKMRAVSAINDKAMAQFRGLIHEGVTEEEIASKMLDIYKSHGVGLDVVKSNIEALGGDVEVRTQLGEGTTFIVRLPLTLAIIQALMVEIRDEKYAIALGSISNIESIPVNEIKYVQAQEVIHLRGAVIPLIRLDQVLDMEEKQEEPENLTVVIVKKGDSLAGLVVDNLIGQQEIVIKSLGKYINNNKIISGATILGDGEVALILDVNTLM